MGHLSDKGVEICSVDFSNPSSLEKAVKGVHRVFISLPVTPSYVSDVNKLSEVLTKQKVGK